MNELIMVKMNSMCHNTNNFLCAIHLNYEIKEGEATLTTDFTKLNYIYGLDNERRIMTEEKTVAGSLVSTKTKYYSQNYEKESITANGVTTNRELNYIFAPDGLAAIYEKKNGNGAMYYTSTDHLGSINIIADKYGSIAADLSYDAWGNRRNPADWQQKDTRTNLMISRGYIGQEHLDAFGLINLNGRIYEPLTARFLSTDNYVQAPGYSQSFNRYAYGFNNPLLFSDADGEFIQIVTFALVFSSTYLNGLIRGESNPGKNAWKTASYFVNQASNAFQIPVYNDNNTSISAGINVFGMGISANVAQKQGDLTYNISGGYGVMNGWFAYPSVTYEDNNGWSINIGGGIASNQWALGANIKKDGFGGGYYFTKYGEGTGYYDPPNSQTVGGVNVYIKDFSFRLENDFLGDGHDRWRSNAAEFGYRDFVIGTNLYNNDPAGEGLGVKGGTNLIGKENNKRWKYSVWKNGDVYSSPLWIGYRFGNNVDRIGYSHPLIQDRTQNWVHRNGFFYLPFGHENFYTDYEDFQKGIFLSFGYYNAYSLWGY